jgi:DNA-binding PadR family transcriptional regulator
MTPLERRSSPKGDLTPSMAVLGLLCDRPDSASRIAVRLEERYPHGRWAKTTNYAIFLELAKRGAIEKVRSGTTAPDDIYKTTSLGATEFKEWLREAVKAPPRIRDPTQAWVQHSDESELREIIQAIGRMQKRWRVEYEKAQERLKNELKLGSLGPSDGSDWPGRARHAVLEDTVRMCLQQVKRCMALQARLENREMHSEDPVVDDG